MRNKPNLLFVFSDQQRFDTMACYGNETIQTPNLNALARESFVFENAYVSQPVCVAARTTIMTGLYPHTLDMGDEKAQLPPAARTIAEMVSQEYCCGYNGKWDLGDEVMPQHGFQEWVSTEDLYRGLFSRKEYLAQLSSYHHFLVENGFEPDTELEGSKVFGRGTAARLPEQYTKAMFQSGEAARFIKEQGDHPFILYVSYLEVWSRYILYTSVQVHGLQFRPFWEHLSGGVSYALERNVSHGRTNAIPHRLPRGLLLLHRTVWPIRHQPTDRIQMGAALCRRGRCGVDGEIT